MEFWVEKRGDGDEMKLEFESELASSVPVRSSSRLGCTNLQLDAEFLNIIGCILSLRYEGTDKWQDLSIPDQICASLEDFGKIIGQVSGRHVLVSSKKGNWIETRAVPPANYSGKVEFKFNAPLSAVLGVQADKTYSAPVSSLFQLNALVEYVTIVSPLVTSSLMINQSELRSLATFWLEDGKMGDLMTPSLRPVCLPSVLSRITFSVNSFLVPSLVLRAKSFRCLASFVLSPPEK